MNNTQTQHLTVETVEKMDNQTIDILEPAYNEFINAKVNALLKYAAGSSRLFDIDQKTQLAEEVENVISFMDFINAIEAGTDAIGKQFYIDDGELAAINPATVKYVTDNYLMGTVQNDESSLQFKQSFNKVIADAGYSELIKQVRSYKIG